MNEPPDSDETIFAAALQWETPAQRAAYLDEACAGQPERRRRVEELLRASDAASTFLERPVGQPRKPVETAAMAPTLRQDFPEDPLTERPGAKIGRYKLLQQIGEGGCGTVFMAEQEEPVRRRVALKVIKLGMDTKSVVARFEAERQALAMMDHPNIAKVLDAGATDSGRPFFVMELVRGIPITRYCDENKLDTQARLDLFIKVCHAIQHAHQKGIIHRDIKPSNILVTLHDGTPVPKVIDFGIAKATEGRLTNQTLFTAFEQFIGTPAYMSPEQAEMSGLDIDTRSDIYALGVLLYELLTGKTPFDAKELVQSGIDAMRKTIREREPQRPSTRLSTMLGDALTATANAHGSDPVKLLKLIRGDLDWIVMKCLEKDRTRRYDTANGLAADLKRHLTNEPVLACPPSAGYRFQKAFRRNKLIFAAVGAVVGVLTAGVVVSAWQAARASREARRAVAAEGIAQQRLTESEAISKFMTDVFQSPDPTRDGREIKVVELLDKAAEKLETGLAAQPAQRLKLQFTLGQTYHALGLYREAIPLLEKARDYHLKVAGPEHPDTLDAMHCLALSYLHAERTNEALKLGEEVLALRRKVSGPEHRDTLPAMHSLAIFYFAAGRKDEALKLQEEVLPLLRKVLGPELPETLAAMGNLASSYFAAGRLPEALKLQEYELPLQRKVNGPEHPDTLIAMGNLASYYVAAGRKDEALKLQEDVLPLQRKVNGPEHPETLVAMGNLASSYFAAGRKDEALKLQEEVLTLQRKVLGPEHPDTLVALDSLASSYFAAGRLPEALKLHEEVLTLQRKVNGPEHPDTLDAMDNLASSCFAAGRIPEALKLQEEVLTLSRRVLGPEHPDTLIAMDNLASYYFAAGRKDEALKLQEEALPFGRKALAEARTTLPKGSPELARQLAAISQTLLGLKAWDEAEPLLREALAIREKKEPDDWRTFNTRSMLGGALLGRNKLAEAEPLLLDGYKGMKERQDAIPAQGKVRLPEALERLVKLHEAKGSESEAAAWRGRLEAAQAQARKPDNLKP